MSNNITKVLSSFSRAVLSRLLAKAMTTKGRIVLDEDTQISKSTSGRLVVTDSDGDTQTFPSQGGVAPQCTQVSKAVLVRVLTTVLSPRGKVIIDEETKLKFSAKRITFINSDGDRQAFAL